MQNWAFKVLKTYISLRPGRRALESEGVRKEEGGDRRGGEHFSKGEVDRPVGENCMFGMLYPFLRMLRGYPTSGMQGIQRQTLVSTKESKNVQNSRIVMQAITRRVLDGKGSCN